MASEPKRPVWAHPGVVSLYLLILFNFSLDCQEHPWILRLERLRDLSKVPKTGHLSPHQLPCPCPGSRHSGTLILLYESMLLFLAESLGPQRTSLAQRGGEGQGPFPAEKTNQSQVNPPALKNSS